MRSKLSQIYFLFKFSPNRFRVRKCPPICLSTYLYLASWSTSEWACRLASASYQGAACSRRGSHCMMWGSLCPKICKFLDQRIQFDQKKESLSKNPLESMNFPTDFWTGNGQTQTRCTYVSLYFIGVFLSILSNDWQKQTLTFSGLIKI